MVTLFGTDGVRGVVNATLLPELAYQLGRAAGSYFSGIAGVHRFLVGRDTRISGTMIEAALAAGLCASGINVDIVGVIPTPGVAYLTRTGKYDAGVVISASHNPFPDNGIKFFDANGFKLPDAAEEKIEELLKHSEEIIRPTGKDVGVIRYVYELAEQYTDYVLQTASTDLHGIKVVTDSANGAASNYLPRLLKKLGAEVIAIHKEPNGINIIANDGDADRCLFVDEEGQLLDGDHLMIINALRMKQEGRLSQNLVVGTVMSNLGFGKALESYGIRTSFTQVGDRYVLEEMKKHGYSIGGEQSGHIIFLDYNSTGDGLITAVQTLVTLKESGKKLSELRNLMTTYPQLLKNVKVYSKIGWENNELIQNTIEAAKAELGNNGRILVRASGTEPLIRVMGEASSPELLERVINDIVSAVEQELGVE